MIGLGLVILLAFAFQGSRGIYAPDEGFYVGLADAMVRQGDYLIPRLQGLPWLDKPPLSLWGIAAGLQLLGHNEWGARAFHALCYLLTVALVYLLGRSLYDRRSGLLAALFQATMLLPFAAANFVTPDTPLALWSTLAFFFFWKSVEPQAHRVALWKMLLCAALGLGFLTKGPAALIPAGALFAYLLLQKRTVRYFLTGWAVPGLALFSLLGLGWYIYVARELPGASSYFWDNQVFGRMISSKYSRNAGLAGAAIYLPVILAGTLPWSICWWPALWRDRARVLSRSTWSAIRNDPTRLLVAVWIAVPLLVLVLASSKLPLYALPVFPALALATARLGTSRRLADGAPVSEQRFSRGFLVRLTVWVILLLGLKFAAAAYPERRDMRALATAAHACLPAGPCEIAAVDEQLEGLGFYEPSREEQVTTRTIPYPFFVPAETLAEEVGELGRTAYRHVFVCRGDARAQAVRTALSGAGVAYAEFDLPFSRRLMVCEVPQVDRRTVRLVALGVTQGGGGSRHGRSVACALDDLNEERILTGGVVLLGGEPAGEPNPAEAPQSAARELSAEPFAVLRSAGVSFYSVLGDDDVGASSLVVDRPSAAQGERHRRFYSKRFGGGLVELFVLDSGSLVEAGSPADFEQLAWLTTTLAASRAAWKIVATDEPLHTTALGHPSEPGLAALLEPLLVDQGVAIVLQGRNAVYERLRPLRGIVYLTSGNGVTVGRGDLRENAELRAAGNDRTAGFVLLEFVDTHCRITAFDSIGSVIDKATLERPRSPRVPLGATQSSSG